MARSIQLSRTPQSLPDQTYQYTVVSVGTNTASEIFVLRRTPADPLNPSSTYLDEFTRVASPADITNLPINAPTSGNKYFRKASFTKVYQTRDDANVEWPDILSEVRALVRALNASDQSSATEVTVVTG